MGRLLAPLLCLAALSASAAEDPFARGIDVVPVKLTPSASSGLTLESGEMPERGSFRLTPVLDFNVGILALKLGSDRLGDLIPFRTDLHLMASYQVLERLELAADLPIVVANITNFSLLRDQGFPQASPNVVGLGALRVLGRFQIIGQREIPIFRLAAVAEVRAPTGDQFSFMSDRGFVLAPRLAGELRFGPVRVLANAGWRFRTAAGRYLNLYVGHEFAMGGGAIIELPDLGALKRPELLGDLNIVTPAEAPFTFRDSEALKSPFELMIGARAMLCEHWGLLLAVARGLGQNGYGRETIRFVLGLRYENTPITDSDGDGIPDKVDQCPSAVETKNGFRDLDGCPDEAPDPDRDGDTVPDRLDTCPDQPGPQPLDGCPDRDGDQIPDISDKCPDQPGPAELNGCPPPPEEEEVVLESERIRIRNQVLYEFGSAKIDKQSYPLLDEVAKVLAANPEVGPVLIEGHTDSVGPRLFNIDLSKRRAKAVEDYLVAKGIAQSRLRSDGFGFDRPLAPNDTPLNRAKNRRTEFKLVDEVDIKPGSIQTRPDGPIEIVPKSQGDAPVQKPVVAPKPGAKPAPPPTKPAPAKPVPAKPAPTPVQPAPAKPAPVKPAEQPKTPTK